MLQDFEKLNLRLQGMYSPPKFSFCLSCLLTEEGGGVGPDGAARSRSMSVGEGGLLRVESSETTALRAMMNRSVKN